MNSHLLEMSEYDEEGYSPLIDFQSWRVAILNYIDELDADKIDNFQCHNETDEVFVLLTGKCILFCAELDDAHNIIDISTWDMDLIKPTILSVAYTIRIRLVTMARF